MDDIIMQNETYESPTIKLVEFEVEVGFVASQEMLDAGFNGTIQKIDHIHEY